MISGGVTLAVAVILMLSDSSRPAQMTDPRACVVPRRCPPTTRAGARPAAGVASHFWHTPQDGAQHRRHPRRASLYYGDPVHWAAIFTSIGAVLGGLAIVLAFVQLRAPARGPVRAQISKIGYRPGPPEKVMASDPARPVALSLFIRNSSELPVLVHTADPTAQAWGYDVVVGQAGDEPPQDFAETRAGDSQPIYVPGDDRAWGAWAGECKIRPEATFLPRLPRVTVNRVVVTDAAGYQWEIRRYSAGPPRRVRRWRRWWWQRHGRL